MDVFGGFWRSFDHLPSLAFHLCWPPSNDDPQRNSAFLSFYVLSSSIKMKTKLIFYIFSKTALLSTVIASKRFCLTKFFLLFFFHKRWVAEKIMQFSCFGKLSSKHFSFAFGSQLNNFFLFNYTALSYNEIFDARSDYESLSMVFTPNCVNSWSVSWEPFVIAKSCAN